MTSAITTKPIIGFVGKSGSGKTTLLKSIIQILLQDKIRVAVIKHSHHDFEIDIPGKDSYELRHAGAHQILITSKYRTAIIHENLHSTNETELQEPSLLSSINQLDLSCIDIILVEGFKQENIMKIEIHQKSTQHPFLFEYDKNIIALASDEAPGQACDLPIFALNTPTKIATFLKQKFLL